MSVRVYRAVHGCEQCECEAIHSLSPLTVSLLLSCCRHSACAWAKAGQQLSAHIAATRAVLRMISRAWLCIALYFTPPTTSSQLPARRIVQHKATTAA